MARRSFLAAAAGAVAAGPVAAVMPKAAKVERIESIDGFFWVVEGPKQLSLGHESGVRPYVDGCSTGAIFVYLGSELHRVPWPRIP